MDKYNPPTSLSAAVLLDINSSVVAAGYIPGDMQDPQQRAAAAAAHSSYQQPLAGLVTAAILLAVVLSFLAYEKCCLNYPPVIVEPPRASGMRRLARELPLYVDHAHSNYMAGLDKTTLESLPVFTYETQPPPSSAPAIQLTADAEESGTNGDKVIAVISCSSSAMEEDHDDGGGGGDGGGGDGEDREMMASNMWCAVCLCEFEDGERGRLLPRCRHTFHAACIDMWFFCHSTCPLCRTPIAITAKPPAASAFNPISSVASQPSAYTTMSTSSASSVLLSPSADIVSTSSASPSLSPSAYIMPVPMSPSPSPSPSPTSTSTSTSTSVAAFASPSTTATSDAPPSSEPARPDAR